MTYLRRCARALGSILPAFLVSACTVGMPFRGPGLDPAAADAPGDVVLAVTHAVLDPETRGDFDDYIFAVADTLDGAVPGLVGYSIRKEIFGDEVWTMSVWRDDASLETWSRSPKHREAIAKVGGAIVTLRTGRFRVPAEAPLPAGARPCTSSTPAIGR